MGAPVSSEALLRVGDEAAECAEVGLLGHAVGLFEQFPASGCVPGVVLDVGREDQEADLIGGRAVAADQWQRVGQCPGGGGPAVAEAFELGQGNPRLDLARRVVGVATGGDGASGERSRSGEVALPGPERRQELEVVGQARRRAESLVARAASSTRAAAASGWSRASRASPRSRSIAAASAVRPSPS